MAKSQTKCPYCKKTNCIPDVVYMHCESYDGTGIHRYNFRCVHCDKVLEVDLTMTIIESNLKKSDKKEGDWG